MADHRADVARTMQAYDEIAGEFAERTWRLPLDEMRKDFLTALEANRPAASLRILDAGCGPGRDVAWFLKQGLRTIGGDRSAGMLSEARRRVPDASLVRMDLRAPPFRPQTFDGVWLCASLLHLPKGDWLPALRRYHALLDGGRLFIAPADRPFGATTAPGPTLACLPASGVPSLPRRAPGPKSGRRAPMLRQGRRWARPASPRLTRRKVRSRRSAEPAAGGGADGSPLG